MRFLQNLVLFFSVLAVFVPGTLHAAESEKLAKIRILPEYGSIAAGQEIWLGIEQSIEPGWHTYWKNPGDSGAAPRIEWTLPAGFSVGEIHWPAPDKLPYGPLLNYGYSDHVILLQKLKAPDDIPTGPLTLKADVEILVCKEECIPEFSTHTLQLNGPVSGSEQNTGYLSAALEKVPEKTNRTVSFGEENGELVVRVLLNNDLSFTQDELASVQYFPVEWGLVDNTAAPQTQIVDDTLVIRQTRGERALSALDTADGVITYEKDGKREAFSFTAQNADAGSGTVAQNGALNGVQNTSFLHAALFALLGGLILNLMPCVFPVLSIKALSLVKCAEKQPELARMHGLAYTAGVVLSFLAIAGLLLILKASGVGIGWGFQLQNPIVVSLLAYMLFIVGLNLSGYFEITGHFGNLGDKLTRGEGLSGSFFTGVLATIVATPCTAPFMALAIGYALLQPAIVSLSVFAALGLGLALPYLALSFMPPLQKALPRPGPWMETFRELLAFPMFASAAWLVWVLSQQAGPMGVMGILFGMVALTFGFWLMRIMPEKGGRRTLLKILAILAFLIPVGLLPAGEVAAPSAQGEKIDFGEMYSPEKLETLLQTDEPVFVEMTAAWCITCKVNHAVAIDIDSTRTLFAEHNVRYLIGDWTNYDPEITKFLNTYGRDGVPIYVYYGPRDDVSGARPEPVVLPQILVPDTIRKTVENS